MQYTVAKPFKCKVTKKRFAPGSAYETTDQKRAAFLMENGLLKKQEIEKPEPAKGPEVVENVEATEPPAEVYPKHVGGGYWETPDGERYKGKEAALEVMGGE